MKKIKKKLLIVSDDYDSYPESAIKRLSECNYFYDEESNWLELDVTLVNSMFKLFTIPGLSQLRPIKSDITIIDFSLISYGKWEHEVVKRLAKECKILLLTSLVNEYVKGEQEEMSYYKQFPVVNAGIDEMISGIYSCLESAGLKEKWMSETV